MEAKNEKKWVRAPNNFSLFLGGGEERQIIKQNFKFNFNKLLHNCLCPNICYYSYEYF